MQTLGCIADLGAVLLLVVAAMRDVVARRVPNTVALGLLICGFVAALAEHRLAVSAVVALIVFGLTLALWLPGCIGGADAKLLTACGLLLPPVAVPYMMLITATAGGILCLPYLPGTRWFRRPSSVRPSGLVRRVVRCERWRLRRRGPLPYAVAIAAGNILILLHGS